MDAKIKGFEIITELVKLTELITDIETKKITYNTKTHDSMIKIYKDKIILSVQCL